MDFSLEKMEAEMESLTEFLNMYACSFYNNAIERGASRQSFKMIPFFVGTFQEILNDSSASSTNIFMPTDKSLKLLVLKLELWNTSSTSSFKTHAV